MATFQTAGYPAPPHHFSSYATYRASTQTPPPTSGSYAYYSPRQYAYPSNNSTPAKGHARRATGDGSYTYTYTTTTTPTPNRTQNHSYSTPEYAYYTSAQSTPQRKSEYVSGSDRKFRDGVRHSARTAFDGDYDEPKQHRHQQRPYHATSKHYSSTSRAQYVGDDYYHNDRSYEYLPRYELYESRPPPYHQARPSNHHQYQTYHHEFRTDHRTRDQVPIYTPAPDTATQPPPRQRRASYTTSSKPTNIPSSQPQQSTHHDHSQYQPRQSTHRSRPSTATKSAPKATQEDALRAGIPAGYSFKNWDPTEEPILLLGSVFDANSLGKWIYDWTVFFYGPATPMSEIAGELWILLIQLAHKVKRAEDAMPRVRAQSSRDLVDDFLDSGERLWQRFNKLLKICENYMWKAAKKESNGSRNVTMGQNSGCEFVDAIFGRDRELERTEKLMTGMRLWSMRFDANCEEILRHPSA